MEQIIYNLQDHRLIASVVSFTIVILETFLPILPLVAIVGANAFVLGVMVRFFYVMDRISYRIYYAIYAN